MINRVLLIAACVLSGAALTVSLLHGGPRGLPGPAGPQGQTGRNAEMAHLGLCVNMAVQTGVIYLPVNTANPIAAPVVTDGVPSCPSGQFVSIVPGS